MHPTQPRLRPEVLVQLQIGRAEVGGESCHDALERAREAHDALLGVANADEMHARTGESFFQERVLRRRRVLKLIHEDMAVCLPQRAARVAVLLEDFQREGNQIIESDLGTAPDLVDAGVELLQAAKAA